MSYINPIALFGKSDLSFPLQEEELEVIRKKLLEKDLEKNVTPSESVEYSEIEVLIFKIQIPSYQELFYKLWRDRPLHNFLESGNLNILKKENILYSTRPVAYFKFWKPFFIWRYNIELGRAYFDKDVHRLRRLQELPFDLTMEEKAEAFKDLKSLIDKDLRLLGQFEVEAKDSFFKGTALIKQAIPVVNIDLINTLPKGLTLLRSVFAYRLLELSMVVYNQQQDFDTATTLLKISQRINLASVQEKDLNTYSNQLSEYIKTANLLQEYGSEIRAHLGKLRGFQRLITRINENNTTPEEVIKAVEAGVSPQGVARLPERFHFLADEYSKALRIFSAYIWNNTGEADKSGQMLALSEKLPLNEQQAEQLEKDKGNLKQRIEERHQKESLRGQPPRPVLSASNTDSNIWTAILTGVVILAFISALIGGWDRVSDFQWPTVFGAENSGIVSAGTGRSPSGGVNNNETRRQNTSRESSPKNGSVISDVDSSSIISVGFPIVESRLETGDSPYDPFYGKGRFNDIAQSWISVKNLSGLDVVVCLEEKSSGKTIRNEYIRAGDQFKMTNLPEGYYMMKTFYGRNWNHEKPFKDSNVNLFGGFTENFFFKKPDGEKRYWEVYDLNTSFTSYEITLEPLTPSITTNLEPVNGGLLSWNLRDFGQTKNAKELELIGKIIKNFDLITIQEVVAGPGGARTVALLADELNRTGAKWDYRISDPTQSPLYKTERYAFLWKTGKVELLGSPWLESSLSQKVYREPYLARFSIKEDTFLIASYHSRTLREEPQEELRYLFQLPDKYPNEVVILAGDFNTESNDPVFQIIYSKGYLSSPNFLKTTLKTQCNNGEYLSRAIDHIFYPSKNKTFAPSGVIDFVGGCEQLVLGRQISDHLPVWVQLVSNDEK